MITRIQMEKRRLRAFALLREGVNQTLVSRAVGVSRTSVCRWVRRIAEGGEPALYLSKPPGRPPKLTEAQFRELRKVYSARAKWTGPALADAISARFGVHYNQDHAGRILLKLRAESRKRAAGGAA